MLSYSATAPASDARYTTGLFNGPGTVKSFVHVQQEGRKGACQRCYHDSTERDHYRAHFFICSYSHIDGFADRIGYVGLGGRPRHNLCRWLPDRVRNQSPRWSTDLIISYEQGGSCYDYNTCYVQKKAYNMDNGFNNATFYAQNQRVTTSIGGSRLRGITSTILGRRPTTLGSLTARVTSMQETMWCSYDGASAPTYHKGWKNGKLDMAKIASMVPTPGRVWITGSSAGAFGAILQYQNAQDAFPGVRVDLLADSGETPFPSPFIPIPEHPSPRQSRCPTATTPTLTRTSSVSPKANPSLASQV